MSTQPTPKPSRLRRRLLGCLLIPLGLCMIGVAVLAALPVEADAALSEADWNVGTVSIEPAWTGLLREWPANDSRQSLNPDLANLGYQLFFDPALSGSNDYSCAHCHHPDLGFSDGLKTAVGADGRVLTRNAPSLWNVAYDSAFFWDGRASSLEEQLVTPITAPDEMNQDFEALVEELSAIEAYQSAFESLFPDGITQANIASALATFQRTLISDQSAFDRYVQGEFEALTPQQRRGLGVFRSAGTRCFECHINPTFSSDDFRIIGVPDEGQNDIGYGAVAGGEAMNFAFKVPSLRNAVLSAPFMHNGHFDTLEAVVDFYARGGGKDDFENVDRHVQPGFENLSQPDRADLVAFLYALVDESLPEEWWGQLDYLDDSGHLQLPQSIPSGLDEALVTPQANPAREVLDTLTAAPEVRPTCQRDAERQTVQVTSTIQAAVDCAQAGDTILVPPGVYHERVIIDQSDITLKTDIPSEPSACPVSTGGDFPTFPEGEAAPQWAILDGDIDGDGVADLTDGLIASGNNFRMEYFIVRNYSSNGVLVEGVRGVTLRHIFSSKTGLYGVYPVRSDEVLVECNVTNLATDAGIYVGQSRGIIVRNNLAYDGVTGIEIENSVDAEVYENETHSNTGGILVFLLPNIHSRVSQDIILRNNYTHHNNRPKGDATPGSIVGDVPIGTGILLMATDYTQVYENRIEYNDSFGISLVSLYQAYEPEEIGDVGPLQEHNRIFNNTYVGNGQNAAQEVTDAGFSGADVLWDTRGFGNYIDEPNANVFPPIIPGENWPEPLERAIFQILNTIGKNL
jgi:parallel beta-helix repeat protein